MNIEITQELLTNIFLIILLLFPAYSFIRTIYYTYSNELLAKMGINLATFVICFILFIMIYQLLWLPNRNSAELMDYIIKVSSAFVFLPSIIINAKLMSEDNDSKKEKKDKKNEQ